MFFFQFDSTGPRPKTANLHAALLLRREGAPGRRILREGGRELTLTGPWSRYEMPKKRCEAAHASILEDKGLKRLLISRHKYLPDQKPTPLGIKQNP
jgi:hypothetical protein